MEAKAAVVSPSNQDALAQMGTEAIRHRTAGVGVETEHMLAFGMHFHLLGLELIELVADL